MAATTLTTGGAGAGTPIGTPVSGFGGSPGATALAVALSHPTVAPGRAPTAPAAPLADVIDLTDHLARRRAAEVRAQRFVFYRRRAAVLFAFLALVLLLALAFGGRGATADLERPEVAGHVVVAPGESLWGVAAANAPDGEDPRAYLERLIDLNGFDSGSVPAWTVVLLPAAQPAR